MKRFELLSTAAVLSLAIGLAVPAHAQQEQHDQQEPRKTQPAQHEEKTQQAKPAKQEEKPAPQKQSNARQSVKPSAQQHTSTRQQAKTTPQQSGNTRSQAKTASQRQQHTQQAKSGQQAQRAGNNHGRIPDDRFRANFGQDHHFRVSQGDYRNHRFHYGGYWFGFAAPWPSNWLYTQDVYVVDIDGAYYLCNPMYPGVNVALSVTL